MTNARQMSEGGWERLELTEHYAYMCLCRRAHELYWTHNFFILDKSCPILTRRWCFFHRRQRVSYPRESGSHLALTSRCSSILAIGGFITRSWTRLSTSRLSGVEKVSRVHSTEKSLDHHSSRGWVMSIEPTISIGRWPAGKSSIRKVDCRIRKLASAMSKVGCGKQKLKGQMLNVGWKNECTFHWTWRSN